MTSRAHTPAARAAATAFVLAATLLSVMAPARAPAQERQAEPDTVALDSAAIDSLARQIRRLQARIDSIAALLGAAQDTAGPEGGELAALRKAAREAAGGAGPDTATGAEGSRTRNLNRLNPEISVTGDILGLYTDPGSGESNLQAVPRGFELSIQSALDPYSRAKVFIGHHEDFRIAGMPSFGHGHGNTDEHDGEEGEHGGEEEAAGGGHGGFELEEGYIQWVGLPGGLGLKAGKFRQEIGLYNRWHDHALLEVQRPLPLLAFLGEDGLSQTGAGLSLPSLTTGRGTHTAFVEVATGTNDRLFEGGNELSYLGRLQSFWDLSPSTFFQLGATGVYGENDGASLVTRLLELDAYFRWKPSGEAMYRDFRAKTEWYFVEQEEHGIPVSNRGGYVQLSYQFDRRWVVGLRGDYLDGFGAEEEEIVQLVPSVTWWQSEWVRLRLQYNHLEHGGEGNHSLVFQTVWAVGPHKHETY